MNTIMDLKALKRERKNLRISFTSCTNKVTEELLKLDIDLKSLSVLQKQLEDKFGRLDDCQKNISSILLKEEGSEKEYEEDFQAAEEYRVRYLELKTGVEEKMISLQTLVFENRNESLVKRSFKLPKIESKKFNGDVKDYLRGHFKWSSAGCLTIFKKSEIFCTTTLT